MYFKMTDQSVAKNKYGSACHVYNILAYKGSPRVQCGSPVAKTV